MSKKIAILLAAALANHLVCYAAEPPSGPQPAEIQGIPATQQAGPLNPPEQVIAGQVTDSKGTPVAGAILKLFADGKLMESTTSASSGAYEIRLPVNIDADETVTLWVVPTRGNFTPKYVVLRKSSAASKMNLFTPCADEVRIHPQMRIDVKLLDEGEYIGSLKARNCL